MDDDVEPLPKMHDGMAAGDGHTPSAPRPAATPPRPPGWRSLVRGVVVAALAFLFWNLLDVGALMLPLHPLLIAVAELAVILLFAWRYLPRRPTVPGRPHAVRGEMARHAVLRLRPVPRSAWGAVAAWVGATLVLDTLFTMVYFHLVPRANHYPELFPELQARPLGWIPLFLALIVSAPLIEEVVFRGWIQRPLERVSPTLAIALTSLLFALAHGFPPLIPYYVLAGVVLGASVYLTRSLWVAIVAHAAHNAWTTSVDALGLTNDRLMAWAERPAVFWLAVAGLAGWAIVVVWLGGRMRAAFRAAHRAAHRSPSPSGSPTVNP